MFPPPTPWKQIGDIDPEREYPAFTSRFFLKSVTSVPGFVSQSRKIQTQANAAPGVVGWSLAADLFKLEFHTLSVWEDDSSLSDFVAASPHHDAFRKFATSMRRPTIFVHFRVLGKDLPVRWKDAVALQNDRDGSQP